ncbi:MAG: hypothetical protein AB8G15_08910 [Saprospiraceae bacterium]
MQALVLSPEQRSALTLTSFQHLAGFLVAPTAYALKKGHVFELFKQRKTVTVEELRWATEGNVAYLQLALDLLCGQGWVQRATHQGQITFTPTTKGLIAFDLVDVYRTTLQCLPIGMEMNENWQNGFLANNFELFRLLMQHHEEDWHVGATPDPLTQVVQEEMLDHLEGMIVGPILVALSRNGFFEKVNAEHASFKLADHTNNTEQWQEVFDFLTSLAWFTHEGDAYQLTAKGLYLSEQAHTYGLVVSYLPSFTCMSELLYGHPRKLWEKSEESPNQVLHRDTRLYAWASAKTVDTPLQQRSVCLTQLFDRPLVEQAPDATNFLFSNQAQQRSYRQQ